MRENTTVFTNINPLSTNCKFTDAFPRVHGGAAVGSQTRYREIDRRMCTILGQKRYSLDGSSPQCAAVICSCSCTGVDTEKATEVSSTICNIGLKLAAGLTVKTMKQRVTPCEQLWYVRENIAFIRSNYKGLNNNTTRGQCHFVSSAAGRIHAVHTLQYSIATCV